ncbi:MAG: hypothetical protein HQL95_02140 [Magnetococcales bacterium]|nr:hypothetical protein [Magnetococcales bacterium]
MAQEQADSSKQLEAFPAEWRALISDIIREWGIHSLIKRRDLAGKSGASLWVVDVQSQSYHGAAILKVSSDTDSEQEIHRHKQALALDTIKARIPGLPLTHTREGQFAMLMTIAGNALSEVEPLARCGGGEQQVHLQQVADLLLKELNPTPTFSTEEVPASDVLRVWLKTKRCDGTSRLVQVLVDILHVDDQCPGFRFEETDYPNPFVLCQEKAQSNIPGIVPVYGYVHGDLHENNILVRGRRMDTFQYLIDFAFFEGNKPLFFDHAYLELSLLLQARENASLMRWMDLVQGLTGLEKPQQADENAKETDDQGLLRSAGFIRGSVLGWIDANHPHRKEDLKTQLLLARIAAGLNFAAKRLQRDDAATADKLKAFAFLYAASAARKLFAYKKLDIPQGGPVAQMNTAIPKATSQSWREVWDACNGFDRHHAAYVLVVSEEVSKLPESSLRALGKVPWSLIIEFHPSPLESALYETSHWLLRAYKSVHRIFPSQEISLDFASALCWVMAEGDTQTNGVMALRPWGIGTLKTIRSLGERLRKVNTLRPIHLLVLGDGMDPAKLRATIGGLDEATTPSQVLLVRPPATPEHPTEDFRIDCEHREIICHWQDLAYGLDQMIGDQSETPQAMVPVRNEQSGDVRLQYLPEDVAREIAECLEVVHSGLANRTETEEVSDFLQGNTITWREVDLNRDVVRETTMQVINTVRTIITERREKSYTIEHTPGAGGTTLARRIAWSLRNDFPSVVLTSYMEKRTAELVERLFQFTHLPVFVVVEEARLSGTRRDLFFNELKSRTIAFVILDVRRRFQPRDTLTSYALADPMSNVDAQRFLEIYRLKTPANRHQDLERLATYRDQQSFRSAFFFGLIAFGEEFMRIPDYVAAHIGVVQEPIKEAMAQLALITRYSQGRLPIEAFIHLLGISHQAGPLPFNWRATLDSAAVLLVNDGRMVGIAHPLLADEILRQTLPGGENWRANLADYCIRLIEMFAIEALRESDFTQDILTRIFLSREPLRGTGNNRSLFSELINLLPTDRAKRRVMEALCDHFKENGHFWNHLGRLINFMFEDREAAKQCFHRAINLKENEEEHHHGLGMVFRFEVRDMLNNLSPGAELGELLRQVQPLFEEAEACFQRAREIHPMSDYALFTPIQMAHHTLERLMAMRGSRTYGEFLALKEPISQWGREILERSEGLLERFRNLHAGSDGSEQLKTCSGWIQGMQGDVEGMITTFTQLLSGAQEERKPLLRRTLARAYLRRESPHTDAPSINDNKRIAELMAANLMVDPLRGGDLLLWLRAARMLPNFTLTEAMERFEYWAASNEVDADYYLYILHFLNLRKGATGNRRTIITYIEKCKRKGNPIVSKNSFEWVVAETLNRPCPLVHFSELGGWDNETRFVRETKKLAWVEGRIEDASQPQSGIIEIDGIPAFFVPRPSQRSANQEQFWSSDRNIPVLFHLGFTYEGPRAWSVRRKP